MSLLTVFQVCFYVGVGLILLSLIFGSVFEAIGIDGFDIDIDLPGVDFFIPVSPILYILFSVVFGGVGWILIESEHIIPKVLIIIIAIAAGLCASSMLHFLVIKPLKKAQNTSAPTAEELVGLRATVTETIIQNGFGEISYTIHGNSYTSPAKTTTGDSIKRGRDVAICWIEDFVFYVTSIDDKVL